MNIKTITLATLAILVIGTISGLAYKYIRPSGEKTSDQSAFGYTFTYPAKYVFVDNPLPEDAPFTEIGLREIDKDYNIFSIRSLSKKYFSLEDEVAQTSQEKFATTDKLTINEIPMTWIQMNDPEGPYSIIYFSTSEYVLRIMSPLDKETITSILNTIKLSQSQ